MSGLLLRCPWVGVALCVALLPPALGSPLLPQEPLRCAPCTPEKTLDCPAVAPGCAEVLREPGCGCCLACALAKGDSCGIYTAPCGSGLRCVPRAGDPRPLHSLTRGQGVCAEVSEVERSQSPDHDDTETDARNDHAPAAHYPAPGKPFDPRVAADAQESMKAKVNAIRKKLTEQGPCHMELYRALEKIAKSQQNPGDKLTRFYLPNCDKHGFYKAKQCETSLEGPRGKCWCVSSWNGKRILGSSDVLSDSECQQELTH
ncbi:insulin-like growth factor binding protein 1 A1 precursor-like [Arapaima gigas]